MVLTYVLITSFYYYFKKSFSQNSFIQYHLESIANYRLLQSSSKKIVSVLDNNGTWRSSSWAFRNRKPNFRRLKSSFLEHRSTPQPRP